MRRWYQETRGQPVSTGPRAAAFTDVMVMGGRLGRWQAHSTERMPDASTHNTVGHEGGGRDRTSMAAVAGEDGE